MLNIYEINVLKTALRCNKWTENCIESYVHNETLYEIHYPNDTNSGLKCIYVLYCPGRSLKDRIVAKYKYNYINAYNESKQYFKKIIANIYGFL